MRTQLKKIAEIAKEFVKLGVQMGMPTGFNYFNKKKDWVDDVHVIYISQPYSVSSKSSFKDDVSFGYKDIEVRLKNRTILIPLDITNEQLDETINELEFKLEYLKSTEGLLELKEVVDEVWDSKRWEV